MHPTNELSRRKLLGIMGTGVALVAAGPLLTACSNEPAPVSSSGGAPRRGGNLRIGAGGGSSADHLNPLTPFTDVDSARVKQLYETLLEFDDDYVIQPALAEEVTSSPDAKEWTIRLRDDVLFHDGKKLTAEDVVYTFERVTDPKDPGGAASRLLTLDRESMQIIDPLTVRLTFTSPFAPFREVLAEQLTAGVRVIPKGRFDPSKPIGTGPFKFESFTAGERSIFTRNDEYWRDGEPYVDRVEIINFTDESAKVNALLSGQVDASAWIPASQIKSLAANPQIKTLENVSGRWNPFVMRLDMPPFDDVRVRQAMRLLVDREQMVNQAIAGYGSIANDIYGRFDPAYNAALPQREVDIDQAKSLLRQAGRSDLQIELVTSPISSYLVEAAEVLVQQAKPAGVDVKLNRVDPSAFWGQYFLKTPFTQQYWGTRNFLLQAADSMVSGASYPETAWKDEAWSKLVTEAFATIDDARQVELIHAAQKIEYDKGGYINWGWITVVDAMSTKVNGLNQDKSGISLNSFKLRQVWLSE